MKKYITLIICTFLLLNINAQKFITSGTIEYEVKGNVIKSLSFDDEDDDGWLAQLKEQLPAITVNYYTYTFNDNKSLFKFSKTIDTKKIPEWLSYLNEDDVWYNDYNTHTFINKKTVDESYIISGELKKINWKLHPTESMVIAGFNCRKASAIIFDSVYVFAYYTDEIAVSGGPMSTNGLPGMILGLTVPRLYTSWVATMVKLDADVRTIKPPTKGKKKTEEEIKKSLSELSKSWGKDGAKYLNPMIWRTFI